MTVIAWDGKSVAADRRAERGAIVCIATKLWKGRDGWILATCGRMDQGIMVKNWFNDGADPEKYPEFMEDDDTCLIAIKGKQVRVWESQPEPGTYRDKFSAWGSGAPFAIGAMAAGATPLEACKIAGKHCVSCGNGYDVIHFED